MSEKNQLPQNRERWQLLNIEPEKIEKLSKELDLPPLLSRLLLSHDVGEGGDIDTIQEFINPSESLITDTTGLAAPEYLKKALDRIQQALESNESIMVNGDPDADGITAVTVLVAGLRHLNAEVSYDFPTRSKEGHGLQARIIDLAKSKNIRLILTADCGSKDVEAVKYANTQNIDVIVTDHHILGKKLPDALAVVNPYTYSDESYIKSLSGSGIAFKLICALYERMNVTMDHHFRDYLLSVCALGTISDRMTFLNPMNRIMVKRGIEALNKTRMEGLKALKRICAPKIDIIKPREIGRTLVPRLNAPGRIGDREEGIPDSRLAVDLLLIGAGAQNANRAEAVIEKFNQVLEADRQAKGGGSFEALRDASVVDDVNEKRKYITSKIEDEIDTLIDKQVNLETDRVVVVYGHNWNPGVIGIDTDRLRDRFLRPAIILTEYDGNPFVRGSCRSIPTINMYQLIEKSSEIFEEKNNRLLFKVEVQTAQGSREVNAFGGHSQACGFTLHKNDVDAFLSILKDQMSTLPDDEFNYSYDIVDTLSFDEIGPRLIQRLDKLMPYGQEFEYPIFYMKGCILSHPRPFGNKYQEARTPHLEFKIFDPKRPKNSKEYFTGVGFGLYEKFSQTVSNHPDQVYDIIFTLEEQHGLRKKEITARDKIRLNVLDIRKSSPKVKELMFRKRRRRSWEMKRKQNKQG